jgi:prepilin-type N-terminal cleavage/methylation domain-containing protein
MIRRAKGFTLIEVMIGIGIVAVLGLSVGIIFGNINRLAAKPEAILSAQVVRQMASLILRNSNLCDHALRAAGVSGSGASLVMQSGTYPVPPSPPPPATASTGAFVHVDHIQFYDPAQPSRDAPAITTGMRVGQNMYIKSIDFYETTPGLNRSNANANGIVYNVFNGFIQITFGEGVKAPATSFSAGKQLSGGVVAPERIPIVLAARQGGNNIDFCYGNASFSDVCNDVGGHVDATTGNCASTINNRFQNIHCPPSPAPPCGSTVFPKVGVYGITSINGVTGQPACDCIVVDKTHP